MNRRGFLKGFCAVTGTLAVAPCIALAPVEVMPTYMTIDELTAHQMLLNQLLTFEDYLMGCSAKGIIIPTEAIDDFNAKKEKHMKFMEGAKW